MAVIHKTMMMTMRIMMIAQDPVQTRNEVTTMQATRNRTQNQITQKVMRNQTWMYEPAHCLLESSVSQAGGIHEAGLKVVDVVGQHQEAILVADLHRNHHHHEHLHNPAHDRRLFIAICQIYWNLQFCIVNTFFPYRRRRDSSRESDDDSNKQKHSPNTKHSPQAKHHERKAEHGSDTDDVEMVQAPESTQKDARNDEAEAAKKEEEELPPYFPGLHGCRSVEEFKCLNRIAEGTYGIVFRAQDKRTEEIVALKRLKMEKEKDGFPITSLREINTLLKGQHPNIVTVREIVVGSNMDKIFIVMDYVEHDFKTLMETMQQRKQSFLPGEVKCLTHQLLRAVAHLHDNWILHRDLKTSNLLLSHKGILKVGDFGLAREYGSPLKQYTSVVVTLWYRAPELLLNCKEYSTPIDMWSVGCIFAEFLAMCPLFPGQSETDQLNKIFKVSRN